MRPAYAPDQVPQHARKRLLDRTPAGARVLDVGCWSGFNGRHLIESRAATVTGVEPNVPMAGLAADAYTMVHNMTVEEALEGALAPALFDVILVLDVLEHLTSPETTLRKLNALLTPDGRLLVSIPNVAHWSVRKMLMAGHWDYTDNGILDRTHLHFFTKASAEAMLARAGYRVLYRDFALDRPPLIPLAERHRGVLSHWPGLFAAQFLFDAQPTAANS